jgi:hypothetical protein
MRERSELALKIACAVLAAVLLVQAGRVLFRGDSVQNLKIPSLPTLATAADSATNNSAPGGSAGTANAKGKTNRTDSTSKGTNSGALASNAKGETNSVASTNAAGTSTNLAAAKTSAEKTIGTDTPIVAATKADTNSVSTANAGSNAAVRAGSSKGGTNLIAAVASGKSGTNNISGTNTSKAAKGLSSRPDMAMMGGPMGRPGGKKAPDLAPPIQARVDKIVDSELLGPVIHPLPMALLGIAGNVAIIRSPSGQTGLVKEGDSLGELKLLRIGTNRVLVEQAGEKKELMIFSGYGGETLVPKEKDKTNETTSTHP